MDARWQALWDALSPDSDHSRETLTRLAKQLKRDTPGMRHGEALDAVARRMGYPHWAALSFASRSE